MPLFSLQHLPKTCLILRRNERDMIKNYIGFHLKYPLSDLTKHDFFPTDLEKILKDQIGDNPSSWSRVVPCGQRDGQA
jgi:hypothetical protein